MLVSISFELQNTKLPISGAERVVGVVEQVLAAAGRVGVVAGEVDVGAAAGGVGVAARGDGLGLVMRRRRRLQLGRGVALALGGGGGDRGRAELLEEELAAVGPRVRVVGHEEVARVVDDGGQRHRDQRVEGQGGGQREHGGGRGGLAAQQ